MKQTLRAWTLRITATAIFIALLLIIIVLYPVLTYAHTTPYRNFRIFHNSNLAPALTQRIGEAEALARTSTWYDAGLRLDICLDDGAAYSSIVRKLGGAAFARGFYDKVVLMAPVDWERNSASLNGYRWNATQLLAHEMVHCYQFRKLGLFHANPLARIPDWKWEGYPEYVARRSSGQQDLAHNIARLQQTLQTEHNGWITFDDSTGTVLPYYESWLLMQYCMDIRHMSYEQVLADTTPEAIWQTRMMQWYREHL